MIGKKNKGEAQEQPAQGLPRLKTKLEVVDHLKQFSRFLEAVIDLRNYVDDLDKLEREANAIEATFAAKEQREAEINGRIAEAEKDLAHLEGKKAEARRQTQAALDAVKGEPARFLAEAKAEAAAIVEKAKADAADAAREAERKIGLLLAQAAESVAKAKDEAAAIVRGANEEKAAVDGDLATARAALRNLEDQADEKAGELDGLNKKIDAAKAHIAKLLGA